MSASPVKGLWPWVLAACLLALGLGHMFLPGEQVASIGVGCVTAMGLTFMLQRMAGRAIAARGPGKALILSIFLKSSLRFLLTGAFLAILFYLRWITPLGFIIGFTAVVGVIFVWGCSRLFRQGS